MGLIVNCRHFYGISADRCSGAYNSVQKLTYTFDVPAADTYYAMLGSVEFTDASNSATSQLQLDTKSTTKVAIDRGVSGNPTSSGFAMIEEKAGVSTTAVVKNLKIDVGGNILLNSGEFSNFVVSGNTITFDCNYDPTVAQPSNIYHVNAFGPGVDPAGNGGTIPAGGGNIIDITRTTTNFTVTFRNNDKSAASASDFGLQFVWFADS